MPKLKSRKYQLEDIEWILEDTVTLYAADIGVGKSLVALKVFEARYDAGEVERVLIVATPRIIEHTWPAEIRKWTPHFEYAVLHGGPVKIRKALEKDVAIYLTTYDTMPKVLDLLWDDITMIIFDECHKLKGGRTARFRAIKKHIRSFPYRLMMSGWPMPNSIEDLWSQAYLLDEGASLGRFITHFRNRYMLPHYSGFGWMPRPGIEDELFADVEGLMLRREATREAGIPKVLINDVLVTLPPQAKRIYMELEDEFMTKIQNEVVSVFNAGAASMKLRQVCNGFAYGSDGKGRIGHEVHPKKFEALAEILETLDGNPTLVAYSFQQDAATLLDRFEIPSFTGVSGRKAQKLLDDWNAGLIPALAIHPASAGEGLNLQEGGHHLVWFGLPWDPGMYHQTIGRLARSGQRHAVIVHRLIAKGSIEERMADVLIAKTSNQKKLFAAIRQGQL